MTAERESKTRGLPWHPFGGHSPPLQKKAIVVPSPSLVRLGKLERSHDRRGCVHSAAFSRWFPLRPASHSQRLSAARDRGELRAHSPNRLRRCDSKNHFRTRALQSVFVQDR